MTRDSLMDEWVERARVVPILPEAERLGARLRRVGAEHVGPCPVCGGKRDKLSIHPVKGIFNCGHQGGAGGDVIALVQHLACCEFLPAVEMLAGPRPDGRGETAAERAAREQVRAERAQAADADRARRDAVSAGFRERERERSHGFWRRGAPVAGTIADRYLAHRGLELPPGARLRFAPDHAYFVPGPHQSSPPRLLWRGPALLAAITASDGRFRGLHQTWLDPRLGTDDMPPERDGKALVVDPETGEVQPAKKVRGSAGGHRIELVRIETPRVLVVGEGIETTLSVWLALRAAQPALVAEAAFWAAISLGNLTGKALGKANHPTLRTRAVAGRPSRPVRVANGEPDLASIALAVPDSVEHLILLGDGDSDAFTTGLALERAARRHLRRGDGSRRIVTVPTAPPGTDFNQVWRAQVAA